MQLSEPKHPAVEAGYASQCSMQNHAHVQCKKEVQVTDCAKCTGVDSKTTC